MVDNTDVIVTQVDLIGLKIPGALIGDRAGLTVLGHRINCPSCPIPVGSQGTPPSAKAEPSRWSMLDSKRPARKALEFSMLGSNRYKARKGKTLCQPRGREPFLQQQRNSRS
uniref:Uncharacterized protein n=1 Tax=Branchiostoma floridae TaxID=7739 RepID=C3YIC4_BRAFL|eukprot:XP_002604250.1 hypothetical protein BRAFLDRAFT_73400 [Branchiostoma floridae]